MSATLLMQDLAIVLLVASAAAWACRRLGLSTVVGYLAAGMVVGPYTPPFQLVTDLERIQLLAQVGLVFLVFSIGLALSLPRLRRLGASVVLATAISAVLVFNLSRLVGLALGWSGTEAMFLAGILVVSSSAIISKVLEEANATHQRAGQLALGVTVVEDVVAVVMLTLLTSVVRFGEGHETPLVATVGALFSMVAFLGVLALLVVPRLLARLGLDVGAETRNTTVAGLMLLVAWVAVRLGYSSALGAFVLGAVVGSTPQGPHVARAFDGMRQVFGAVFFVAMGMLFDVRLLAEVWPLVLLVSVVSLVGRTLACTLGLVAVGNPSPDALRAGLTLNPLGEFSFIIAHMGVAAAVLPPTFYPMAVGVALVTSLVAPVLTRHSGPIADWLERRPPLFVGEWILFYQDWLVRLRRRQDSSLLWRLVYPRVWQVGGAILVVSAMLLLAAPLYAWLEGWLGRDWLFTHGLAVVSGTAFGLVLLAPLVAIWRNLSAMAMILAEALTTGNSRQRILQPLLRGTFKSLATAALVVWLLALTPFGLSMLGVVGALAVFLALVASLSWSRLVRWHTVLEVELRDQILTASAGGRVHSLGQLLASRRGQWNLELGEAALPEQSAHAGRSIRQLDLRSRTGCSIVALDRQGYCVLNPRADDLLYPGDRLMLLGSTAQLAQAEHLLSETVVRPDQGLVEMVAEHVTVPPGSAWAGKSLVELDMIRILGVQVGGIRREGAGPIVPTGSERLQVGDVLLVLGNHEQIEGMRAWLLPTAGPGAPAVGA
jgi:CPA2 family monovalent cation:H+ antiporter-2